MTFPGLGRAVHGVLRTSILACAMTVLLVYLIRAVLPNVPPAARPDPFPGDGPAGLPVLLAHARAAFAAGLVLIAALGAGEPALAWLLGRRGDRTLGCTAGLGLLGTALLGLGFAGLLRTGVLASILALPGLAGAAGWRAGAGRSSHAGRPVPVQAVAALVLAAVAVAGLLLSSLAPETDMDSLKYHLAGPAGWARDGRLAGGLALFDRFPSLWEALLVPALAFGGEPAAKMLAPAVAILGGLLLLAAVGRRSPLGGALAAGLWLTGYDVGRLAVTAKNDLLVSLFSLAAFAVLVGIRGRRGSASAGIFLGFACLVKPTALLSVAAIGGLAALGTGGRRGRSGRVLVLLAAAVAAASPWLLRNWMDTGNPAYPFGSGLFGAGPSPATALLLHEETHGYTAGRYATVWEKLAAPWTLIVAERHMLLPALLLPACLVALGCPGSARPWAAAGIVVTALWTLGPPQLRFLVQGLPFLCGAAELVLAAAWSRPAVRRAGLAVALAATGLECARGWLDQWADRPARVRVALGLASPGAYRTARLTTFAEATTRANAILPLRARVFVYGDVRVWPLERRALLRTEYESFLPLDLAAASGTDARLKVRMRQFGSTHLLYDRNRAVGRGEQLELLLPPDRALVRWARWWRAHARLAWESPAVDPVQGGYSLWALDGSPGAPAPPSLDLPGVEGWLFRAQRLRQAGRTAEARAVFAAVNAAAGDVAFVQQAGVAIFGADLPPAEVRRTLKAVEARGLRSVWLLTTLARLAADSGDEAEARDYSRKADALVWKR